MAGHHGPGAGRDRPRYGEASYWLLLVYGQAAGVRCGTGLGYGYCSLDGRVLLVSRYGGAGGYLRYANCLLIGAGIEFEMEHARLEGVRGRTG